MKLDMSCDLPCRLDQAKRAVKTLGLLNYVASPILKFDCIESIDSDAELEERAYVMKTKLFGLLPLGLHTMEFSYKVSGQQFIMRDNGHSALCKKWDHRMIFQKIDGGVRYQDSADIQAGIFTPLVWLFGVYLYRHRQGRWKQLVKGNFQC